MKTRNGLSWKESSLLAVKINKEKTKKRIEEYNFKPVLCKLCKTPIPYEKKRNKFCSHSCAASCNNLGVVRNFKEKTYEEYIKEKDSRLNYSKKKCLFCSNETSNFKFCSFKCSIDYKKQKQRNRIQLTNCLRPYKKDKWYLIETRGNKCEVCNYSEWMGKPLPLDIHHIDGNSDNNLLSNVRLICPNCHRQTPTHGSKNKGNGRSKRKQYRNTRYKSGLSY